LDVLERWTSALADKGVEHGAVEGSDILAAGRGELCALVPGPVQSHRLTVDVEDKSDPFNDFLKADGIFSLRVLQQQCRLSPLLGRSIQFYIDVLAHWAESTLRRWRGAVCCPL